MYSTKKFYTKIVFILLLCFTTHKTFAQDPDLLRTWYMSYVINDFNPTRHYPPAVITQPATITFLDTGDAINIIGFSGCNTFQVQATYGTYTNFYGIVNMNTSTTGTDYCSNAYDFWEGRFFWMLDSGELTYILRTVNGVDYLDLEHPLMSGIYLQSQPLSVEENSSTEIRIFPNPVAETLYVTIANEQIKSFVIHNIQGQKIKEAKNSNNALDVKSLAKGVYFLEIVTDKGKFTHKFIKK
ncbi:T9SS type A sorting domain-containing protein [Kordia sp. YSTF-M3]|uniref:T9SS type A sorting domain-containing protein n=1 Tax=Kordia aestuariivivens TaxID=2759037 RepID=A0ABR7Q9G6_9FLAO|nr:T9SS type A sorting domain-containing protein [Kordia aestuariivivens]MBC8755001.1 T9SS type A sorting domain-containing protein [Kordia aestuariivivens]